MVQTFLAFFFQELGILFSKLDRQSYTSMTHTERDLDFVAKVKPKFVLS